jgi:hypothetical protein
VVLQTPGAIDFSTNAGVVLSLTNLPVGSVLVFDGDVMHRGVDFSASCAAMHAYLDVPEVRVPCHIIFACVARAHMCAHTHTLNRWYGNQILTLMGPSSRVACRTAC